MAPVKFGLFKARSRDQQEQPSTENLLQSNTSLDMDQVATPDSPLPSTSKGFTPDAEPPDMTSLHLDSEDEDVSEKPVRRHSDCSGVEEPQVNYNQLRNQTSTDATSTSTLNDNDAYLINDDDASTSCDVNSLQFEMLDDISMAPSEDLSVHCGTMRRLKKNRSKEERLLRDYDMWRASNVEVMKNLLSRSGTHDDQIKWEAIATARGLCTLTDSCTCGDCTGAKYLAAMADGDGGLGTAPLFSAMNVGCVLQ